MDIIYGFGFLKICFVIFVRLFLGLGFDFNFERVKSLLGYVEVIFITLIRNTLIVCFGVWGIK